jgi:flavodoxin I
MKVLVVFDSFHGNTEKVVKAMADALTPDNEVELFRPAPAGGADLKSADVLIVGSPTLGGRASQPVTQFLDGIPEDGLKDVKVLAFDTRLPAGWVRVFGYAAEKISSVLKEKGANLLAPPEGFSVKGSKGPLKDG